MKHVLVTNDFPPKVGGIQSYLWELWRRLDPESFAVLTASSDPGSAEFDAMAASSGVRIERTASGVLFPTPGLVRHVRSLCAEIGASLVVVDPAIPLGLIGPHLGLPYAVVLHGAEVTVPARLPGARHLVGQVVGGARLVVSAGEYAAREARRAAGRAMPEVVEIPPGVDVGRFVPLDEAARAKARDAFGIPRECLLVTSVSRLVPRKGMDTLVTAAASLRPSFPQLAVAIAGDGRDRRRIQARIDSERAPVRLLGRVSDEELANLYGASDLFAMLCRNRWMGLEQEGFGIVFLEAAACGVAQIAGRSGGAHEAVADGSTGLVVDRPADAGAAAGALRKLLGDPGLRNTMGQAARARAEASYDYDLLARRLSAALEDVAG